MLPGDYPLNLYRGDSYAWDFVCWADDGKTQPVDLTGAVAKAEIRNISGGATIMELACSISGNTVTVELDAALWATWTLKAAVWDLQLTYPSGTIATIVAGKVTITPDVTDSVTIARVRSA